MSEPAAGEEGMARTLCLSGTSLSVDGGFRLFCCSYESGKERRKEKQMSFALRKLPWHSLLPNGEFLLLFAMNLVAYLLNLG